MGLVTLCSVYQKQLDLLKDDTYIRNLQYYLDLPKECPDDEQPFDLATKMLLWSTILQLFGERAWKELLPKAAGYLEQELLHTNDNRLWSVFAYLARTYWLGNLCVQIPPSLILRVIDSVADEERWVWEETLVFLTVLGQTDIAATVKDRLWPNGTAALLSKRMSDSKALAMWWDSHSAGVPTAADVREYIYKRAYRLFMESHLTDALLWAMMYQHCTEPRLTPDYVMHSLAVPSR